MDKSEMMQASPAFIRLNRGSQTGGWLESLHTVLAGSLGRRSPLRRFKPQGYEGDCRSWAEMSLNDDGKMGGLLPRKRGWYAWKALSGRIIVKSVIQTLSDVAPGLVACCDAGVHAEVPDLP